jgi:CAAX protease family protein
MDPEVTRRHRPLHDLLVATLVGLSWFVLARVSFELSRKLVLAGWFRGVPWWHVLSTVRLMLGLAAYIPLAIAITWRTTPSMSSRLRALGLLPSTWGAAACGMALVAGGVLVAGPVVVYSRVAGNLGSTVMGILSGLQPPVVEEFLIRGIVWAILARRSSTSTALAWSSLLHWTYHLEFGLEASLVSAAYSALVCGGARLASGTIWPGLVFHLILNAGAGQVLFPAGVLVAGAWVLVSVIRKRRGRTSGCS